MVGTTVSHYRVLARKEGGVRISSRQAYIIFTKFAGHTLRRRSVWKKEYWAPF